jgi:hypothetical protein
VIENAGKDAGIDKQFRRTPEELQNVWSEKELASLSLEERERLSSWIMELINADVAEAKAAGSFDARIEAHLSRTLSQLDEQGWRDLNRLQDEALETSFAIQAESAERLAQSGEAPIPTLSAMLCFELPREGVEPA